MKSLDLVIPSRLSVGDCILDVAALTDVGKNLRAINRAYRSVYPETLFTASIDCTRAIQRFQACGLRPQEDAMPPFAFGHRTARFYLSGKGSRITLRLFSVSGQKEANMELKVLVNDEFISTIPVDWEGEKTFEFSFTPDDARVAELRVEHNRLWRGCFPKNAAERDLGIGFQSVTRTE